MATPAAGSRSGRAAEGLSLGALLGVHYSNVSRRRVNGFSPEQVEAMWSQIEPG